MSCKISHHRATLTRTFKTKSPPPTGATQQEIFPRSPAFLLPFFRKGRRDEGGHESSCTSCNLLGQKALAGFLRTSYPRSRSANSAKNRLGVCKTPILLSQNRGSCGFYKTSRPTPSGPAPPSHRHASGVTVGVIKIGLSPFGDRGSFTSSLLLIPSSLPPFEKPDINLPPTRKFHLLRHISTPPLASSKVYNSSIPKGNCPWYTRTNED